MSIDQKRSKADVKFATGQKSFIIEKGNSVNAFVKGFLKFDEQQNRIIGKPKAINREKLVAFVLTIKRHSSVIAWVFFYSLRRWCVCTADSDKAGRMDGAALLNTVQIYRKENADMAEETKQTPKLEIGIRFDKLLDTY